MVNLGYEVEAQFFLEKEAANIEMLVEKIRQAADAEKPDSIIEKLVVRLIQIVKNWDTGAQPIQVSTKSRGLDHDASYHIAGIVRDLAIYLFNEHGKLDFSQRLTGMLQEVFAEVAEVAERTAEDTEALAEIAEQRKLHGFLDPISNLCKIAFENAEKNPSLADKQAQQIIDMAPRLLSKLADNRVPDEIVAPGKDEIALVLMRCAVLYGNKTEKWKPCITILDKAFSFATNQDVKNRITKNLQIVRQNDKLFSNLSPISSTPSLRSVNGIGFTLYGSQDKDSDTGSYLATYYFVFFFIPIFPIRRYRVIPTANGYQFLGKTPLRSLDKWHLFISLALMALFAFYIVSESNSGTAYQSGTSSSSRSVSSSPRSYDNQFYRSTLSIEIENGRKRVKQLETQIKDIDNRLEVYERRMKSYRASGMANEYNKLVPSFNLLVSKRNNLYKEYSRLVDEVNANVKRYNSEYR